MTPYVMHWEGMGASIVANPIWVLSHSVSTLLVVTYSKGPFGNTLVFGF